MRAVTQRESKKSETIYGNIKIYFAEETTPTNISDQMQSDKSQTQMDEMRVCAAAVWI